MQFLKNYLSLFGCFILVLIGLVQYSFSLSVDGLIPWVIEANGQSQTITFEGKGFSTNMTVKIDGIPVSFTYINPTSITIAQAYTVTGTHKVEAVDSGGSFSSVFEPGILTVEAQEIIATPLNANISGGTVINLFGLASTFEPGVAVYFDPAGTSCGTSFNLIPAQNVEFINDDQLEVIVPAVPAGSAAILIDNPTLPDICQPNGFYFVSETTQLSARNATVISHTIPTTMTAGQSYPVSVTMQNTGTTSWTAGAQFRLAGNVDYNWNLNRKYLDGSENIGQSQQKSFNFDLVAPMLPGVYNFDFQMVDDDEDASVLKRFGGKGSVAITVSAATSAICPCPNDDGNWTASIQDCLDDVPAAGGTVCLPTGTKSIITPGLVITKPGTILTISGTPPGTCTSNADCPELKAAAGLNGPIVTADQVAKHTTLGYSFQISYIIADGNKSSRTFPSCADQALRKNGSNMQLVRSNNFMVNKILSRNAFCGTGLKVRGTQFDVGNSQFLDNGRTSNTPGSGVQADGVTVGGCTRLTGNNSNIGVHNNTFRSNTDINLVIGGDDSSGSPLYGCVYRDNNITQPARQGFSGLSLGHFQNEGMGDNRKTLTIKNIIDGVRSNDSNQTWLDFGLNMGPHPWKETLASIGGTVGGTTTNKNTISRSVVNFLIDGYCNATVLSNNLSSPKTPFSFRFSGCTGGPWNAVVGHYWNITPSLPPNYVTKYFEDDNRPNCPGENPWINCPY